MHVGFEEFTSDYIALMALCTSTLSVGAALLDIYASKKLFSVLKQDGQYVGKTSCSISVISTEVKQNATRLQISTYAFREAIAETLSTHPRSVEMHFPIATSTGFKMKFTIFSSKLTPEVILRGLRAGSKQKLPKVRCLLAGLCVCVVIKLLVCVILIILFSFIVNYRESNNNGD